VKKRLLFFLLGFILFSAVPNLSARAAVGVSAESAILIEARTGAVLYEKNAYSRMLIASTTKIMTALVTLEHCNLDDEVMVEAEQIQVEGSSMYLRAGETLTVRELLYGLMLSSGNDAASVLAYHTAGSIEDFAVLMNEKAAELGMVNSSFENPHGLDGKAHYATARDMAVLAAAAMENDAFAEIVATRSISVAGRTLTNHNKLLSLYEGAIGLKTGYTINAGRTLVSCAERNGTRLICVTLNAPDDWDDHAALYDWGFENYRYTRVLESGAVVAALPVISGLSDTVRVTASAGYEALLAAGDQVETAAYLPKFVYAGISAGDRAGSLWVYVNGEPVAEIPLWYETGVALDESIRLDFWERIKWGWCRANKYGMIRFE